MSRPTLNPVSYVILGLVARDGAVTPYQLKQAVKRGIAAFWPFPHTQLYTESARLAAMGLLREEREQEGRRRRTYTITEAGRAALADWLSHPDAEPPQIRDMDLLKHYFGVFSTPEGVREHAQAAAARYRELLEDLQQRERRLSSRDELRFQLDVIRFGDRMAEMAIRFWDEIAAGCDDASAPRARRADPVEQERAREG